MTPVLVLSLACIVWVSTGFIGRRIFGLNPVCLVILVISPKTISRTLSGLLQEAVARLSDGRAVLALMVYRRAETSPSEIVVLLIQPFRPLETKTVTRPKCFRTADPLAF